MSARVQADIELLERQSAQSHQLQGMVTELSHDVEDLQGELSDCNTAISYAAANVDADTLHQVCECSLHRENIQEHCETVHALVSFSACFRSLKHTSRVQARSRLPCSKHHASQWAVLATLHCTKYIMPVPLSDTIYCHCWKVKGVHKAVCLASMKLWWQVNLCITYLNDLANAGF